jgi:hypothetical protein
MPSLKDRDLIVWTCACGLNVAVGLEDLGPATRMIINLGVGTLKCPHCGKPAPSDHRRFGEDWQQNAPDQVP